MNANIQPTANSSSHSPLAGEWLSLRANAVSAAIQNFSSRQISELPRRLRLLAMTSILERTPHAVSSETATPPQGGSESVML